MSDTNELRFTIPVEVVITKDGDGPFKASQSELVDYLEKVINISLRHKQVHQDVSGDHISGLSLERRWDAVYRTDDPEGLLFVEYEGVQIYHTVTGPDSQSLFWFSDYYGDDSDSSSAFDIRELPDPPADYCPDGFDREEYGRIKVAWAIECGVIPKD